MSTQRAKSSRLLQIVGSEARALRYTSEHLRTDFIGRMEGKDKIWPAGALENAMRPASFTFDRPANPEQRPEELTRSNRTPIHPCTAKTPLI